MGRMLISRAAIFLLEKGNSYKLAHSKGLKLNELITFNLEKNEPYCAKDYLDENHKPFSDNKLDLIIPIRSKEKIIGIFTLGKKLTGKDFEPEEINFLESTKLSPKIFKLEDSYISRASQMTQKTTQFNFRTKKYSEAEIVNMKKNKDYLIYLINLKDVYGDHGIISMIILKKINNKIIFLDTMLMSCRVLGRYLDHWIFNECRKIAKKNNFDIILSEFIKTDRNQNFQNSLKLNGFHECKSNDLKIKMNKSQKGFLYKTSTKINKSKFDKIFK